VEKYFVCDALITQMGLIRAFFLGEDRFGWKFSNRWNRIKNWIAYWINIREFVFALIATDIMK